MRAIYLVIALIVPSPCIVASVNAISKIQEDWWLVPAGMIAGIGLIITMILMSKSGKNGL
jgi:hypothetical protein